MEGGNRQTRLRRHNVHVKLALGLAAIHPLLTLWVAWRWVAWWRAPKTGWGRALVRLASEGASFVLATTALCILVNGALHGGRLLFEQLLCQGLFAEGALFLGGASALLFARRGLGACVAPLVGLGILSWVYWEAHYVGPDDLRINAHTVARVTGRAHTLRIAHLSDIQPGRVGSHERRAIRAVMALRPDLICITGDFVDGQPAEHIATLTADLFAVMRAEHLGAPLGVFAVLGDTDGGNADLRPALAGLGVIALSDEVAQRPWAAGQLTVIGLSNAWSRGADPQGLRRLVATTPETNVRIVLGHHPDYVRQLVGQPRVDLCLAGHTHGGQVVLPFVGPPVTLMTLPRRFAAGLNDFSGVPLHVSRGIGVERGVAPQIRFLCPPEVCLIELRL